MTEKQKIAAVTDNAVVAYFDLEFCNERISRHNVPIAIGVSYQQGERELGSYHSTIWCGDELVLWQEQLDYIGYAEETLRTKGKPLEEITEELLAAHKEYQPVLYVSFGKQDEDLLKKFVTRRLTGWKFCDAMPMLSKLLSMKYDVSLEKYAYICHLDFVHDFEPLEDARVLAKIFCCVLNGESDEMRRQEVAEEYDRKIFLIQYRNKQQAYEYLSELPELTAKQQEKLHIHEAYLKKYRAQYVAYTEE